MLLAIRQPGTLNMTFNSYICLSQTFEKGITKCIVVVRNAPEYQTEHNKLFSRKVTRRIVRYSTIYS